MRLNLLPLATFSELLFALLAKERFYSQCHFDIYTVEILITLKGKRSNALLTGHELLGAETGGIGSDFVFDHGYYAESKTEKAHSKFEKN